MGPGTRQNGGVGTKVEARDALVEYLATNFGDDKAPQPPALTRDGSQQKK